MTMKENKEKKSPRDRITVWGVGGQGVKMIASLDLELRRRVRTVAADTDLQSLIHSTAGHKLHLGKKLTGGMGTGGEWELGEKAFQESKSSARGLISGSRTLIIVTGLGGGVSCGVTPALCQMAEELKVFCVVLATRPFAFEGKKKSGSARQAIARIRKSRAALSTFNLDRLLEKMDQDTPWEKASRRCDDLLREVLEIILAYLTGPGADEAVLNNMMAEGREAVAGSATEKDAARIIPAMKTALSHLFLRPEELETARGCLIDIQSGPELSIGKIRPAIGMVSERLSEKVSLNFSVRRRPELEGGVKVSLLVCGLGEAAPGESFPITMKKEDHPPQQTEMDFEQSTRGRFAQMEPTLMEGEDLDIPTFVRRGEKLP